MPLTANRLVKQVDLPVWEWLRPLPVATTAALSASCVADFPNFNDTSGRYLYILMNATNFWRYDTITDSYLQLASPGITPLTATSVRWAGATGYHGRVISATSTTIQTGLPFTGSAVGYRIRITSGRGAGQERIITSVGEPVVADFGAATAGAATSLTDTNKSWGYTGTINNHNVWVGYTVRIVGGTGINQVRKILHNTGTVLTVADPNIYAYDPWCMPLSPTAGTAGWTAPAAGSLYQIESNVITVDTAWDVTPDSTSRYVIQSGCVWLLSGATVANAGITMQYYSVLEDVWYAKRVQTNMVPVLLTEASLERCTENQSLWATGAVSAATATSLTDNTANWKVNEWAGYYAYIFTGQGRGQLGVITSNTATVLTFSNTLGTVPNTTSYYNIMGFEAGTLTASEGRVVTDNTKTWPLNRWANYTLRIVSGTGAGQLAQIQSSGTTSLVLYDTWSTQPDNTSIYVIQGSQFDMWASLGANGQTFMYKASDVDLLSHGRVLDDGVAQIACALPTDGGSTATHEIQDRPAIAITGLTGTTTITATTAQAHQLRVGSWVSIRGVTSAAADVYNVTGKVQIATVPSATTFTYTPFAAGTGTYQFSNNVALGTSAIVDASKYHADLATGGSTTSVTFSRAQPGNINGWYVYGTNVGAGAQVVSGAGTTTLQLNIAGAGTPSGTITFSKWPQPVTATYSSGGGAGVFTVTLTAPVPAYVKGWLVTGTNIGVGAIVTGGEGTATINLSIQCSGAPSGTITFSHPVNNPLPVTATYSSGTGTSITLSASTASYINGWWVSGTNIANGTTVSAGEGTATITLSTATSGTPSGTITFYPPSQAPALWVGALTAPTLAATGMTATGGTIQLVAQNTANGTIQTPIAALASAPLAGVTRYVICRRTPVFAGLEGQDIRYLAGVAVGTQSTTTLVDTNSFWATATGSGGSAGATTFTISAVGSPIHQGWFVSGTNIQPGSRVIAGAGTTSITLDTPLTGVVSGTITFTAWSTALIGRRLRVLSSTGVNQDLAITAVAPATGTLTFATATASATGTSSYAVLPALVAGPGTELEWISKPSMAARRGRYIIRPRGGAVAGWDRFDLTSDTIQPLYTVPATETLGSGTMMAYDQGDRIYFTKDVTNRVYYLDVNTMTVHGAGVFPYLAGTAGLGNKMEILITYEGLKYIWINRQQQVETFRALIFY